MQVKFDVGAGGLKAPLPLPQAPLVAGDGTVAVVTPSVVHVVRFRPLSGDLVELHREKAGAPIAAARIGSQLEQPVTQRVTQADQLRADAVTESRQVRISTTQSRTDVGRDCHSALALTRHKDLGRR